VARAPCLVLEDGHNSHYSPDILEYTQDNNIILVCYPSHTTHVLQGFNIAVFGPFKRAWTQATIAFEYRTGQKVCRENMLGLLSEVWIQSLTPNNIKTSFRKTGVFPINSHVILSEAIAPNKETSIQAHPPVDLPSPIKHIVSSITNKSVLQPSMLTRRPPPVDIFYTPTPT
jgi:hypothetical protein